MSPPTQPTNRLAEETSPYLLQHAHNPVDWYPWGPEALRAARDRDRPIFLSIGYSACHWCHVMERESFENAQVAAFLNEHFIAIKVDREERPDIDEIYMHAVQAMGIAGGWPLSVWLTPQGEPFYGGTYFPPRSAHGRPGFLEVLRQIAQAWEKRRTEIEKGAAELRRFLEKPRTEAAGEWPAQARERAVELLGQSYDSTWGGFGPAPKFPHANEIRLLLRSWRRDGDRHALEMAEKSLAMMWRGGIHDHLGGGFHRYSTDERWLVPHFEKMLYDNALLARAYLDAWRCTANPTWHTAVRETIEYVLREMTSAEGGFLSSSDADSEGEEGRYFVWEPTEIEALLGAEESALFARVYGVSAAGNFEHGRSILHLEKSLAEIAAELALEPAELERRLERDRAVLLEARSRRVPPGTDDKILCDWNGLMITTLAEAYRVFGEERWLEAARRASDFLFTKLRTPEGRLLRSYRAGEARHDALLSDHAYLLESQVALFECSGERQSLERSIWLAERLLREFADEDEGGFFSTPHCGEKLIARFKGSHDGATPASDAIAALALARLGLITARPDLSQAARGALEQVAGDVARAPQYHASHLLAAAWLEPSAATLVISPGSGRAELLAEALATLHPATLILAPEKPAELASLAPLLAAEKPAPDGRARAYLCRDSTCLEPITSAAALRAQLE